MYPTAEDIKGSQENIVSEEVTPSAPPDTGNHTPNSIQTPQNYIITNSQQQNHSPYNVIYNNSTEMNTTTNRNLISTINNNENNNEDENNNTLIKLFKQKKFLSCLGCLSCLCGCFLPNTLWPCLCLLGRRTWFSHRTNKFLTLGSIFIVILSIIILISRLIFITLLSRAIPVCYHTDRNLCTTCVSRTSLDKKPFSILLD